MPFTVSLLLCVCAAAEPASGERLVELFQSRQMEQCLEALPKFLKTPAGSAALSKARMPHEQLIAIEQYPGRSAGLDGSFLARQDFYWRVAGRVVGSATDPLERANRLFEYTVLQVAPHCGPHSKPQPATPNVILLRGYGLCDRAAWVFTTLLEAVGIPGVVIYLLEPDRDVSPHTIAGALINGELYLYDPFVGVPLDESGGLVKPLTWSEVHRDRSAIDRLGSEEASYVAQSRHFERVIFYLPYEPAAFLPETAALQRALDSKALGVRVYANPMVSIDRIAQSVYGRSATIRRGLMWQVEGSRTGVAIWHYPAAVVSKADGRFTNVDGAIYPRLANYEHARRLHLLGELKSAEDLYDRVLADKGVAEPVRQDAEYFRLLVRYESTGHVDPQAVRSFQARHAEGKWLSPIALWAAEGLLKDGKPGEAQEFFNSVIGPRLMRAHRLFREDCPVDGTLP